jgi:ABC-2 type transport system permease protein
MAVYKRRFQPYTGELTHPRFRFLVLSRYAFSRLFHSKLFVTFLLACLGAPAVGAVFIYLHYNTLGLQVIGQAVNELVPIDGEFFLFLLAFQTGLGMLLTAIIGPNLVAPDLANQALPLYFARPFSRAEYVLGKLTVLVGLLSAITWVPLLLLYAFQVSLAGTAWLSAHAGLAGAIWVGSWAWILVLSLLALAFSAWVKWRPVAGFLILGFFMVTAGFAEALNGMVDTRWGTILNTSELLKIVWAALFLTAPGAPDVPVAVALACLAGQCLFFLFLLVRKIRAYEVVRT